MRHISFGGVALLFLLGGCGGGSGGEASPFSPSQEQAAECIVFNVDDLEDVVIGLLQLGEGVSLTPLPANITYDDQTGDYTISIQLPGGGSLPMSGTLTGDDITDGFAVGETVTATWSALGSGTFTVTNTGGNVIRIQGTGMVSSGVECNSSVTVDVTVDTTLVDDLVVTGTIDFVATVAGGETVDGTITFDGSSMAEVSGTFQGEAFSFGIDLEEFEPVP